MLQIEDHLHYKTADYMWKILSPILIILGSIGSVITLIVLSREKSRKTSTSYYLMALAISDFLALNTGLLRQWIKYAFAVDIREDLSEFGCKLHWCIVYLVTQYSSWLLICVTLERVISTWFPHRRNFICTTTAAIGFVIGIAFILLILNSHYFYGYGTLTSTNGTETNTTYCVPLYPAYKHFVLFQWVWIDLCIFYLIPVFVLLVGNCAIIYKVISSQRKTRRTIVPSITQSVNNGQATNSKQQRRISQLTITLMLLSAVFFLCITPIVVYPIGEPYWKKGASNERLAFLFWWETFANLLMYVNHSINCLLYYLSGTKFRKEVQRLVCRRKFAVSESNVPEIKTASFRAVT